MDAVSTFRNLCEKHQVPGGALALMHKGTLIANNQHGIANLQTGVTVDQQTLFHIGSITKVFNATLVLQAVDDGLIDLDKPVVTYLSDFELRDPEATRKVTVGMLLNHTSGIDCDMIPQPEFDKDRVVDGYRSVCGSPTLFPPGEGQGYSNGATLVAGHLIQTVRQRGWYELIRERIFTPLDMEHAVAHPSQAIGYRFAKGHVTDAESGELRPSERAFLPNGMAPAGATLSMTAENLVRFAAMHCRKGLGLNGAKVLSQHAATAMQTLTTSTSVGGFSSAFGLGWGIGAEGMLRHMGAGIGTVAQLLVHPPSETIISVMGNSDTALAALSEFSAQWLQAECGVDIEGHHQKLQPDDSLKLDPKRLTGRYASALCWWEIKQRNGCFFLDAGACVEGVPAFTSPDLLDVPLRPLDTCSFVADIEQPERLGTLGIFLTQPVGVAGDCGDGRSQRFLAGGRVYSRVS